MKYSILLKKVTACALFIASNALFAQVQPFSDPTGNWHLVPELSDEFNRGTFNQESYTHSPLSWTNHEWNWYSSQTNVLNGSLQLLMEKESSNDYENIITEWKTDAHGRGNEADHATKTCSFSGEACLEIADVANQHYYYIKTYQTLTELENGIYNVSAMVWSSGGQEVANFAVHNHEGVTKEQTITKNNGWNTVEIPAISVSNGKLTIAFTSKSHSLDSKGNMIFMRIDDVTVKKSNSSVNLVKNPGFETISPTPFKSGILRSINTVQYGYLEAKIEASAIGTASAFWLYRQGKEKWPEIDIVEAPNNHGVAEGAMHNNYPGPNFPASQRLMYSLNNEPEQGYHIYGLDWFPGGFNVYVDGRLQQTYVGNYFDYPMYIVLSLGLRNGSRPFPTKMQVDYIRVWEKSKNLALNKPTNQSSTIANYPTATSELAVDGNTNGDMFPSQGQLGSVTHTEPTDSNTYDFWEVDLEDINNIERIVLWNRTDCCSNRLGNFYVFVSPIPLDGLTVSDILSNSRIKKIAHPEVAGNKTVLPVNESGRYIRVQLMNKNIPLSLAEVFVF